MTTTDDSARADLTRCFKGAVADHEDVMAECLSMLRMYSLSAQDLFFKYEAFLMSRPSGLRQKLAKFSLDVARELRKELQRESQSKAMSSTVNNGEVKVAGVRRKNAAVGDLGGFLDGLSTPVKKRNVATSLSNTSNNANVPSPAGAFSTPHRTPTGPVPTASSYRPAGPSRLAVPVSTPIGKDGLAPSSPVSGGESPNGLATPSVQPFHHRAQPHSLLETLNSHLPPGGGVPSGVARPRVQLTCTEDPKAWDYRYMFEKMSARSEALDEQIDAHAFHIMDAYGLSELGDPHVPSEEATYTVGRILSPPTDSNKATSASLYLQSSRQFGSGNIVPLRFAPDVKVRGGAPGVRGFGLFPGALVCVKGRNGGGDVYVVEEVLMAPANGLNRSPPEELTEYQQGERLGGRPFTIYSTAGPYTLDDNLDYEPLDALVDVVCDERPDAVIMLGPFVDSAHPQIANGSLRQSPIDLFREQVASRIARINDESPGTLVVLIPSVRDLISRHCAFPQSAFEREGLGLSKRVKLLPNPVTFNLNEVVISTGSVDTLFHLRKEEVFLRADEAEPPLDAQGRPLPPSRNPQGDAMANLVRHVLGHQSFYPLFPPSETLSSDVNLDVTHWDQLRLGEEAPDVLILPSKLKHFSKVVDETLVVNPGHLSRARRAGTFAKITVHPSPAQKLEEADEEGYVAHGVADRARSEVWRI